VGELVLVLCGAVVKAAFALWTGDNNLADNLSADLTDLIRGRVSGALEQRKVRARFDKMEEIVADQVLSTLNAEFRNLDEGEKNAAIIAVTGTFTKAKLTDKALFAANLDPLYLENTVRRFTGNATRDLSWGGTQLYDRVLAQCCAYVIEIADKLPHFQAGAFAELLQRDDQIMARLAEVLERLPGPARDGGGADRVETAYRQLIAKRFDRLELFGLDFAAQWYSLSIAYVDLNVSVERTAEKPVISFEYWLARCPRLLIDGRAGGGKTTILQWIAVRAARRDFEGAAANFNGYVPFFIRLREYTDRPLPQPEEFLDKVASLLAPENRTWPREQLRSGRAFVLIDGVDEIHESQRPAVLAWLQQLTELFPKARYVVTTRPSALADNALGDMDFVAATLNPMEPTLTRRFIEGWHAAMRESQKDVAAREHLDSCSHKLMETLERERFVGDLANTPLLAGLICALNQHLDAQLPRRRGEIFEKTLAMFYERDRKRGITSGVELDLEATYHLLGDLALWMVRNAIIEVPSSSACATLARSSFALPNVSYEGLALYRHLLLRSGLLREPTSGQVDFIHRAFQEYLAARALVASDNVGEIVKNAGDDQWQEVVILSAGLGNIRQTTDLMRGLLRPTWRGGQRYRRRLLAVASLDEIRGADPAVLTQAERAIPELLPPRSLDQAELLSRAGKRVLPHLAARGLPTEDRTIAAVIRAAMLIGGTEALELISRIVRFNIAQLKASMSEGRGSEALDELGRAIDYFDPFQYGKEALSELPITESNISSERQMIAIGNIRSVVEISLSEFVVDGTSLSALDNLEIEHLEFIDCDILSMTGIVRPWPSLKTVTLRRCTRLRDISALSTLPHLEELTIEGCDSLGDMRELSLPWSITIVSVLGALVGESRVR
jgi:hypothetical protein